MDTLGRERFVVGEADLTATNGSKANVAANEGTKETSTGQSDEDASAAVVSVLGAHNAQVLGRGIVNETANNDVAGGEQAYSAPMKSESTIMTLG